MILDHGFIIESEEYIRAGFFRIKPFWLGRVLSVDDTKIVFHITWTQARAFRIQLAQDWLAFIDSCYSLECINEKDDWTSRTGIKQHFKEWMAEDRVKRNNGYFKFDESKFIDNVFCTVFDTRKHKRLILDGLHRANALTIACHESYSNIPQVTIVECFGDRVDVIFPCDLHQL